MASEAYQRLQARLEAKREEFLRALGCMTREMEELIGDHIFRLLGIITYWQTLPEPSPSMIDVINQQLDQVSIVNTGGHQ